MSNYHAVVTAARHSRRALKLSSPSIISGAQRPFVGSASSLTSDYAASTRIPMGAKRLGSSTASSTAAGAQNSRGSNSFAALATTAASLALATSYALSPTTASCESDNKTEQSNTGLADESEEGNGTNVIIQDGMDAGSKTPKITFLDNGSLGPAEAEEDNDDDDDASLDEDTNCSICLINRQGPCRKYWLKFERCMKEHSAEKEKAEREVEAVEKETESEVSEEEEIVDAADDVAGEGGEMSREAEWDAFMLKAIKPGEDDDDEDEDEEDDDDDDDEEDDENEEGDKDEDEGSTDNNNSESPPEKEELSLAARCDKFMLPWIGCIQEHRNIYSLISNAFYQKDYIDPLEDTISESLKKPFAKNNAEIGEMDGYVMKFTGVEIDLGNWREHVEADADDNGNGSFEEETPPTIPMEEPHLINAYAKFRLTDPSSGQPIEVAYIKDQKGRLLGFDSFTKRDNGAENKDDDENDGEKSAAATVSNDGECTFHIVPGETTSIAAYAIYRGERKEDEEGVSAREDFLYHTPEVPLPGGCNQKK